ncbi:MAG: cytidine deaminase [Deltaproteobacteria bacterium]|nr:cytidine deaminase [Deltaproteobacteria bacterium]
MDRLVITQLSPQDRELVARAEEVRGNAYAPYSDFLVGAAVRDAEGRIFTGANLENASYGVTVCAEVSALAAASSAGCRSVTTIAIAGGPRRPAEGLESGKLTMPCGRCRQLIFEAADVAGVDVKVIAVAQGGQLAGVTTIGALLPAAFGPADLAPPSDAAA